MVRGTCKMIRPEYDRVGTSPWLGLILVSCHGCHGPWLERQACSFKVGQKRSREIPGPAAEGTSGGAEEAPGGHWPRLESKSHLGQESRANSSDTLPDLPS